MRLDFVATDPTAVLSLAERAFGTVLRVSGGSGPVQVLREDLGQVRIDEVDIGFAMRHDAAPTGWFHFLEGRSGWYDISRAGARDRLQPGSVVLVDGTDHPIHGAIAPSLQMRVLSLDGPALRRAARDRGDGEGDGAVRFARTSFPASLMAPWSTMVDFITGAAAAQPEAFSHTVALSTLAGTVSHTALALFPNSTWLDPAHSSGRRDRHDGSDLAVRRAIAFMEGSPSSDMSLADIASAAHVTPRALQYGFRRLLGTTPMSYLRRVRLQHARAELMAAAPGTTVAEVAGRWGFFHLGRFASYYRHEFGEYPAHTLGA